MAFSGVLRRRLARYEFIAAASLILSLLAAPPIGGYAARLGEDFLLPANIQMAAKKRAPPNVALIVIDEQTHRTPPFDETPEVAWTPEVGRLLEAVNAAGPGVVGLDLIYPKTLAAPGLLPGFDRPFLTALADLGRSGKLVLSETRLSATSLTPYQGQVLAAGAENLRPVTFQADIDGVARIFPTTAEREDDSQTPSFAAELASRAGAHPGGAYLIDFRRPAADFPAYRLSDLLACARQGRTDVFTAFKGKVVLVGTVLDVEDRHLAAHRFAAGRTLAIRTTPCAPNPRLAAPARLTSPGVLTQAYAVDTLLRDSAPQVLGALASILGGLALFMVLALAYLRLRPWTGAAVAALTAVGLWGLGVLAFQGGVLIPWLAWAVGGGVMLAAVYGYRTVFEDAARRRIIQAFGRYLSPTLVNQLAEDESRLRLGGEHRRVTTLFCDLDAFVTYSEAHAGDPETIVAGLNAVFARIGDIVDAHDGYVDKFIGDAVMAIWGAPAKPPNPEAAAARAALAIVEAIATLDTETPFGVRIGLSAGEVVAGNLGSNRRYNYTVIGEAVNRAARLEEAAKTYQARILADGEFVAALPKGEFACRLVDRAALRGTSHPVDIYEIGPAAPAD